MKPCCQSCGARIVWARTTAGRPIPLDPEPDPAGNIAYGCGPAHVLVGPEQPAPGEQRYRTHFETCPYAAAHRKGRP